MKEQHDVKEKINGVQFKIIRLQSGTHDVIDSVFERAWLKLMCPPNGRNFLDQARSICEKNPTDSDLIKRWAFPLPSNNRDDLDDDSIGGFTALHAAALQTSKRWIKNLIKTHGMDANAVSANGSTPLHTILGVWACERRCFKQKEHLAARYDPETGDLDVPVWLCDEFMQRCADCVKLLVIEGADVELENFQGESPCRYCDAS